MSDVKTRSSECQSSLWPITNWVLFEPGQLHQKTCWSRHAVMEISDQAWELNQMMGYYTIVNTVHHSCDITVVMSNGILTEETLFEGKDLKLNCVKLFSLTRILSSFQLNTYRKRIQIISYIGR